MGNQSESGFIGGRDHPARSGIPDGIGRLISLSAALLRGCHSLTAALIETNKSTLCSHFIQVSHSVQGDYHLLASANTYIHYIYILCMCMHSLFFFSFCRPQVCLHFYGQICCWYLENDANEITRPLSPSSRGCPLRSCLWARG